MNGIFEMCSHDCKDVYGFCHVCHRQVDVKQVDPVNHPPHYTNGTVECIDAIEASMSRDGFIDYCKGNVIKYLWRFRMKGFEVQDLDKADWYLTRMKATYKKG